MHSEVVEIPIFSLFKISGNHKFYIFDFSPRFDGLLGIDFLKQTGASVNLNNCMLETPEVVIPLLFDNQPNNSINCNTFEIVISPRTCQKVKLPVKQQQGLGILNYINFGKAEMPEALVEVNNFHALTTILNPSENPIKINIFEPLNIEKVNETEINFVEQMETNTEINEYYDNLQKQNLKNLRLSHCNKEEFKAIRNLCFQYRDIFYCEGTPLTFTNQIKHKINLTDETPLFTKTYRYPAVHKQEVNMQINKMLENNIIQHSNSPWSSPIWIVPKKLDASGKRKWRIVIDYRKLNEKTIDDKFPLPNISDILDKLGKAQYFSTLDLANGFHQIELDPLDIPKTAFSTDTGHYEFKRMPFGLKNAPSTFQRVMNNMLRGLQNETCLVYLDDIIIFSTSLQEHIERLREVFERLRQSNFKVQLDKSEFLHKEVAYLGHKITCEGVKPNPEKIESVKNFPIPKTQKEIKSFLGLAGYYRRFIKDFAKITKPLTICLKKGAKVTHNEAFIKSFEHLKELLINAPILKYPDFSKPFVLTTDASNIALGAVLSQGNPPNDQPIAYASRTLNETEQKYSTIEKELLGIVWACKYFRPYLYGQKFKIYTDHRPLVWLFNLKEPNSKLVRWRLRLEEFDYEIIYKKGSLNTNADALSRIPINALETESLVNCPGNIDNDVSEFLNDNFDPNNITNEMVAETIKEIEHDCQPKINIISDVLIRPSNNNNQSDTLSETAHSVNAIDNYSNMTMLDEIINNKTHQLIIKKSPYDSYSKVERENFDGNKIIHATLPPNVERIKDFLKEYLNAKTTYVYFYSKELRVYFQHCMNNYFKKAKLVECSKLINNVHPEERQLMIKHRHEGKTNHRGIQETYNHLKSNYYWKSLKTDVTNYINNCEICQRSKYNRRPPNQPLILTQTPTKPFEIIHVDTFMAGNQKFLTFLDKFSKAAQALPYSGNATSCAEQLIHFFQFFGIPQQIVADNGSEFQNEVVKGLLNAHGIQIHFTTPYHHESNSPVERLHSTLIEHLRILKESDPRANITKLMPYAIIAYNSTIHSSTNFTPFELVLGHTDSRDPMKLIPSHVYTEYINNHKNNTQILYEKICEKCQTNKEQIINKINENKTNCDLTVGCQVYKKSGDRSAKTKSKFLGPFILQEILPNNKIKIKNPKNNQIEVIHINETKIKSVIPDLAGPSGQE